MHSITNKTQQMNNVPVSVE